MYLSRTAEMKPTGGIEKAYVTYLGSKDISCTFAPGYNLHDFKLGIETYVSAFKSEQPEGGCDKGHSCKNAQTRRRCVCYYQACCANFLSVYTQVLFFLHHAVTMDTHEG